MNSYCLISTVVMFLDSGANCFISLCLNIYIILLWDVYIGNHLKIYVLLCAYIIHLVQIYNTIYINIVNDNIMLGCIITLLYI